MPTCPCSTRPTTITLPARGTQSGGGCQRWWREWSCSGGAPSTRDRLRSLPSETAVKVLPHRDEDQLGKPLRALSCNSLEWRCDHARWTGARTLLEVSASDRGSGHRRARRGDVIMGSSVPTGPRPRRMCLTEPRPVLRGTGAASCFALPGCDGLGRPVGHDGLQGGDPVGAQR